MIIRIINTYKYNKRKRKKNKLNQLLVTELLILNVRNTCYYGE